MQSEHSFVMIIFIQRGALFMVGTITHDKFSIDVKTQLNKDLPIKDDLYRVASQGHDLGMFFRWYNLKLRGKHINIH